MSVLIQMTASLIAALAAAAFAHFGVTLKAPARPEPQQIIRRIPASDPGVAAKPARPRAPCPLSTRSERT